MSTLWGCLRSLRARSALDGVSWVQGGSVEIAVGQRLAYATISVDSRRRLGADSILGGGRIALMAARAHYVVEEQGDRVLKTFKTQAEAIAFHPALSAEPRRCPARRACPAA